MGKKKALKDARLFVVDLDGTVYLDDEPIEGALDFLRDIDAAPERDYLFFSNNTSRTATYYVEKLARMGFDAPLNKMMTAGDVTAAYLLSRHKNAPVYLNAVPALRNDWKKKGVRLTNEKPEIVVQTFDKTMTYESIETICRHIRAGALFFATHPDINCPTTEGFLPDCGAMCAMITASTGVKPRYFGKPEKETLEMIVEKTGASPAEIAFVGDRIYTDVATGVNHGAKGILVLTGESDMATVKASRIAPTAVYASLQEMRAYL